MGKKGDRSEKIGGPIEVVSVRCEWRSDFRQGEEADCGIPDMTPDEFDQFFRGTHADPGADDVRVTRLEFRYADGGGNE